MWARLYRERYRRARETMAYRFEATAGQFLVLQRFEFRFSAGADGYLRFRISIQSSSAIRCATTEFFRVTGPGPYYLFVRGVQGTAENFSFVVQDPAAAPLLALGTDVTGTLPTGQSIVFYRLAGTAGERVYYDGLGTNDDNVIATLYSPSGAFLQQRERRPRHSAANAVRHGRPLSRHRRRPGCSGGL